MAHLRGLQGIAHILQQQASTSAALLAARCRHGHGHPYTTLLLPQIVPQSTHTLAHASSNTASSNSTRSLLWQHHVRYGGVSGTHTSGTPTPALGLPLATPLLAHRHMSSKKGGVRINTNKMRMIKVKKAPIYTNMIYNPYRYVTLLSAHTCMSVAPPQNDEHFFY